MKEPRWLSIEAVLIMQGDQLAEHGGASGVRDRALLESAIARARNAWSHGETDLCALAALYADGIVLNHPFVDGNKRAAFLAAYSFLDVNRLVLEAEEAEVAIQTLGLAAGEIPHEEYAAWLRANVALR